jgi:dTDP-4-amino-4,6-dideoxygalactose transaminase
VRGAFYCQYASSSICFFAPEKNLGFYNDRIIMVQHQKLKRDVRPKLGFTKISERIIFTLNGRSALILALRNLGIKNKSKIICPAFICCTITDILNKNGFEVEYFDLKPNLQISGKVINRLLQQSAEEYSALIVPHYFGFCLSDLNELRVICDRFGIMLIEDFCHSFLSFDMQHFRGDAAIFSFRKTFNLPGGGIIFRDKDICIKESTLSVSWTSNAAKSKTKRIQDLLVRVSINPYSIYFDFIRALLSKLRKLVLGDWAKWQNRVVLSKQLKKILWDADSLAQIVLYRKRNYAFYRKYFSPIICSSSSADHSVPQVFIVCDESRELCRHLRNKGYDVYTWPGFELPRDVKRNKDSFPNSLYLSLHNVCLPVNEAFNKNLVRYILSSKFYKKRPSGLDNQV